MVKVIFVCYGNICRSPMAEFAFKKLVSDEGVADKFSISSAATSFEEIGNPVHRGTARILSGLGIDFFEKRAAHLERADCDEADYIIGMDGMNVRDILRIAGAGAENKIFSLMDFTSRPREVADPWYTHDFDAAYRDISEGIAAFYEYLKGRGEI